MSIEQQNHLTHAMAATGDVPLRPSVPRTAVDDGNARDAEWNRRIQTFLADRDNSKARIGLSMWREHDIPARPRDYLACVATLDFHEQDGRWWQIRHNHGALGELGDLLASGGPASLRARVVVYMRCIDQDDFPREEFESEYGGTIVGSPLAEPDAAVKVSGSKVTALLGCAWNVRPAAFAQLARRWTRADELVESSLAARLEESTAAPAPAPAAAAQQSQVWNFPSVRRVASFQSNWKVYVSEPHTAAPPSHRLTVFYDDNDDDEDPASGPGRGRGQGHWRAAVACSNSRLWTDLLSSLNRHTPDAPSRSSDLATFAQQPDTLLRVAASLIRQLSVENLDTIRQFLPQIRITARRYPSYLKLNYILHVKDHLHAHVDNQILMQRRAASRHLSSNPTHSTQPTGGGGGVQPRQPPGDEIEQQHQQQHQHQHQQAWLTEHADACAEIQREAETLLATCHEIHADTKDQIAAKNDARNSAFAVVAAVYLPFTLAAGLLGMNIQWGPSEEPDRPADWWLVLVIGLPLTFLTIWIALSFEQVRRLAQGVVVRITNLVMLALVQLLALGLRRRLLKAR